MEGASAYGGALVMEGGGELAMRPCMPSCFVFAHAKAHGLLPW